MTDIQWMLVLHVILLVLNALIAVGQGILALTQKTTQKALEDLRDKLL